MVYILVRMNAQLDGMQVCNLCLSHKRKKDWSAHNLLIWKVALERH